MNIRQATPHDAAAIHRLLTQLGYPPPDDDAFASEKLEAYTLPGYYVMIADVHQEVVAFAALHWYTRFHSPGWVGRIVAFCVSEHVRGQGIGKTLLAATENFFKQQGCSQVEVTSNERRLQAHAFYLNNGYEENSRKFVKGI